MPFVENLEDFVNDDTPGHVLANITGIGVVTALFSDEYEEFDSVISGNKPTLLCISSEVSAAENGVTLVVNGSPYVISGAPQPDGSGLTLLRLKEAE